VAEKILTFNFALLIEIINVRYLYKIEKNYFGDVVWFLSMSSTVNTLFDFLNRWIVEALAWCLLGLSYNDILSLLNCKRLDNLFNKKFNSRACVRVCMCVCEISNFASNTYDQ